MDDEIRNVDYDRELGIEVYGFTGLVQKFPNHFHECYVLGLMKKGRRHLLCKNAECSISEGDVLVFNPRDNHACEQTDGGTMDYISVNIPKSVMSAAVFEITGREFLPYFSPSVISDKRLAGLLSELYGAVVRGEKDFGKEELFLFMLEHLIEGYTEAGESAEDNRRENIEAVCAFLEEHFAENISLDDLCVPAGLSKYHLLREFTRLKGISPYRYLETVRIDRAKSMLERGVSPSEAALGTGFSDQSHFSNYFKKFIGLTPGQYMNIFKKDERE